jgi:hypothetical protein
MPGLGKTRFARDAVHHLAEIAAERGKVDVMTAACTLTPASHSNFARSLVHACYHDCNLRLDCSSEDFAKESDGAAALL